MNRSTRRHVRAESHNEIPHHGDIEKKTPNNDLSLGELKKRIQKQTGFPAELKVARKLLDSGWSYASNPYISKETMEEEVDFHAYLDVYDHEVIREFGNGNLCVNLLIDVKSYNRPAVIFCSDWTDSDFVEVYGEIILCRPQKDSVSRFCLLRGLVDQLGISHAGRSVVVVNNDGTKPKDYDLNQISSSVRRLYDACASARTHKIEFHDVCWYEDSDAIYLNVFVPVIVYDGRMYEYFIRNDKHQLRRTKCSTFNRLTFGYPDRLKICPTFMCDIGYFSTFLEEFKKWSRSISYDNIKEYVDELRRT